MNPEFSGNVFGIERRKPPFGATLDPGFFQPHTVSNHQLSSGHPLHHPLSSPSPFTIQQPKSHQTVLNSFFPKNPEPFPSFLHSFTPSFLHPFTHFFSVQPLILNS